MSKKPTPEPRVWRARIATLAVGATLSALLVALVIPLGGQALSQTAPSNASLPTISGTASKGSTLTATSGSWDGSTPITFAYRWRRCDSAGSNCSSISGAESATYVLTSSDVGRRLRVKVTATNGDGATAATSSATAVVTGAKPSNTKEPSISGAAVEGQKLSADRGTWSGDSPISYAYQWVRCGSDGGSSDGSNCASISGATNTSYVLDSGDVGKRLRVRVTASNSSGSSTAASNPTSVVVAKNATGPPVNTSEPSISGSATQGQTLAATTGTWTGQTPITFTYQWMACGTDGGKSDASNCASISGATKASYVLSGGDVGKRIRIRVTAKNGSGSKTVASNATDVVRSSGPAGAIKLPNGETSIPVTSIPATERLIVDSVRFEPDVVRSHDTTISIRVKVKDTRGYVVRDAIVFIRSTPLVTTPAPETKTGTDGTVTFTVRPQADFPIRNGYSVQFFVKAYRQGDNPLAGVAGYRLVQVATAT